MYPTNFGNHPLIDYQEFRAVAAGNWQIWYKPKSKTIVEFFLLGSGAGGGGGASAGTQGGGGGGSGAMATLTLPLDVLPDRLYIQVAQGGAGGGAGADGNNGSASYVCNAPNTGAAFIIRKSGGSTAAVKGLTAGGGGAGELVGVAGIMGTCGIGLSYVGDAGQGGGNAAAGSSINAYANAYTIGGAGGGGSISAGGNITGAGLVASVSGGAGVASGTGNPGQTGWIFKNSAQYGFVFFGGSGGGGTSAGTGGRGGNGSLGCGGGGGGADSISGNGGPGGNGGDGIVIAVAR